jgi:RND superfamily putative drug exporter
MAAFLFSLASAAIRRRAWVVLAWLVVVAGVASAAAVWSGPTSDSLRIPGVESQVANDLLAERFPEFAGGTAQIVFTASNGKTLDDPLVNASVDDVLRAVSELPDVVAVVSPTQLGAVSEDGSVGIAQVLYAQSASEVPRSSAEALVLVASEPGTDGLAVAIGGEVPSYLLAEVGITSELVGLAVALLVLLLTFGSLIAAGMPLVAGVLGVVATYATIYLVANVVDLPSDTSTLAIMIALAVGIDYALFIVSRYREELAAGRDVDQAAAVATATAGGAVVFAGMTVVVAIAGLAVVGIPFLTTMGFAAAGGVLVAVAIAITLIPALLSFAGRRVLPRARRDLSQSIEEKSDEVEREALSVRWARLVLHRPLFALIASIVALGIIALPALDLRLGFPDDTSLEENNTRRIAFETIEGAFGPGFNAPLTIAVDLGGSDDKPQALRTLSERLSQVEGVDIVIDPITNSVGDTAVISLIPAEGPAEPLTEATLGSIRDLGSEVEAETGAQIFVTGLTAVNIDTSNALGDALIPFLAFVLGLMLLLLVLAFRSIVVAIKAVIAILLSVAASFGALVAVFQWGWFADLIGVEAPLPLIPFLPVVMFAILFGLSMDYEVFILSRVRERITSGDDPLSATLLGLGASARVITAAALIMIAVFGSFVAQVDPTIKMFGIGMATAVLLDATVVRMVFVPAALAVLGRRAWHLSPRLDRILPDLDIEGHRLTETAAANKGGA